MEDKSLTMTERKEMLLNQPVFLVGHARGGTTLLGAIINWHSHVGPKDSYLLACDSINDFLSNTLSPKWHIGYSSNLEQKDIWFDYFPGDNIFTHMGEEMIVEKLHLNDGQICELKSRLTESFKEKRFLSKAPSNSFRIKAIKQIFPDAKIMAILRRGEDVVSSWGQRHYGFGKRVDWGETQIKKLGYIKGICLFSNKWLQTLEYIALCKKDLNIMTVSYEELAIDTYSTLNKIFNYIDLPVEPYIEEIKIDYQEDKWKKSIPKFYHPLLKYMVSRGNKILNNL